MTASLSRKTPKLTAFDSRGLCVRSVAYHCHPDTAQEISERVTFHSFNEYGFPAGSADPRLHARAMANFSWLTDLAGKVLSCTSADAGIAVTLYDAAGRPAAMTTHLRAAGDRLQDPPQGVTRIWQYEDGSLPGRLLAIVEKGVAGDEQVIERFVYARSSEPEQALNLAGRCIDHFDQAGLLRTESIALTGIHLSVSRCLMDAADNPDTVACWGAGQGADLASGPRFRTRTTADATGCILSTLDAEGNLQRLQYDVAGLMSGSTLLMPGGAWQTIVKSVAYSAAGQKVLEAHGNGLVTRFAYEPQTQRLTGIRTERPTGHPCGARVLQDLHYDYDPVGNVLKTSNFAEGIRFWRNQKIAPVDTYIYDSLYQLVSASGREMASAGQRGDRPALVVGQDGATWTNFSRTYSYDCGGNLTRIRHSAPATGHNYTTDITISDRSNRGVLSALAGQPAEVEAQFTAAGQQLQLQPGQWLSWTARGELRRVTPVVRTGAPDDTECYRYGSDRQRVLKVTAQHSASVVQVRRVVYLPSLELRTWARGDTQVESLQVLALGGPGCAQVRLLHWQSGKPDGIDNDQLRYCYENLQGSSSLEVDGHGRVISQESYFPYGGTSLLAAAAGVEVDYRTVRYSGKERDATGLYYYGYRYYQTWTGRWLSADPAGAVDGLNLFSFCRGNPISYLERSGAVGVPVNRNPDVGQSYWGVTTQAVVQSWADFYLNNAPTLQLRDTGVHDVVVNQTRAVMTELSAQEYSARFQPEQLMLNGQSLIERASIGLIYRLDGNAPGEVLRGGFRASSDFSAVENMLRGELPEDDDGNDSDHSNASMGSTVMTDEQRRREQETLIASTEITGVDYFVRVAQARGYLYEIDATGVSGVSVTDNIINNPTNLVRFFDSNNDMPMTRDSAYHFLNDFGVDIPLEEVHVDVAQLNEAIRQDAGKVRFIHRYR